MCGNVRNVHCDMLGAVGWTVFQRRQDGSVNFYRDYIDYIDGFGSADGEYWLGLDNIHCLTTRSPKAVLLVDLADFEGNYKYARYSYFSVGNGDTGYRINIGGYSGTAGDAMNGGNEPVNGMSFTTRDHDADVSDRNCAVLYKGDGGTNPVMMPTSMDSISMDHIHPLLMESTGNLLKVITILPSTRQ